MAITISQDSFVNVIAQVDPRSGAGKILYVNPSSNVVVSDDPVESDFELVVEGADGSELRRVRAPVLMLSGPGEPASAALIQQDIEFAEGARRIRLLFRDEEKDRFEPPPLAEVPEPVDYAPPEPVGPNKRTFRPGTPVTPRDGVTYTVEARREGDPSWYAIAVGQPTPEFQLDRNQFPDAGKIDVRVWRSTGFEEKIVAEEHVSLEDEEASE